MGRSALVERIEDGVGPAAATMVAEAEFDRHFITATVLSSVAVFLAMKYIDGFIKGTGVEDLAAKHGAAATKAVRDVAAFVKRIEVVPAADADAELDGYDGELVRLTTAIRPHADDAAARAAGTEAAASLLRDAGLSGAAARRAGDAVDRAIWTG
jgi:hypothetical protein